MNRARFAYLGRTDYGSCWDLQRRLVRLRCAGTIPDTLVLTEHNHVYTIGKSGDDNHLLAGEDELRERGIAVYHNDRGGDITYHGPGQLVGYPIIDLREHVPDLHRYLRDIEQLVINVLAAYGVAGTRVPAYTGVWVAGDKICAIGIKTVQWVTMHGFALNVSTDLSYFGRIIPCGIFERGVTSLESVLGYKVPIDEVADRVVTEFGRVFGLGMENAPAGGPEEPAAVDVAGHRELTMASGRLTNAWEG
jgi:lipoyl(octanoyl) transferase